MHVRMTLLAILSGHHVLLLGPPGTAKSLLARAVCDCFLGTRFFEYLLSKFSHPDELFGPVSIPGLKEEDYRRLTSGYLPHAHIAFLDEIFKANSAILNSLLTLINERVFHHGKHRDVVPLIGLVGASNEPPDPEGGLGALYDRFLVRVSVPPIAEGSNFLKVCLGDVPRFRPPDADKLSEEDIRGLRRGTRDPGVDQAIVSKHVRESLGSPVEEDTILAPLGAVWRAQKKKTTPTDFDAWTRSSEGTIEALAAALGLAHEDLETVTREIEDAIAATPWQTEVPAQILARTTSLRAQVLGYEKAAKDYAAACRSYSPEARIVQWQQESHGRRRGNFYSGHYGAVVFIEPASKGQPFGLDGDGDVALDQSQGRRAKAHIPLTDDTGYSFMVVGKPSSVAKSWSKWLADISNADAEKALQDQVASERGKASLRPGYSRRDLRVQQNFVPPDFAESAIARWLTKLRAEPGLMPPTLADPPSVLTASGDGTKR